MTRWRQDMGTRVQRAKRRRHGVANYKLVRFADLCRARHKSAYADCRVMPREGALVLVTG
jgi:hypothetical protein